MIIGSHVSFANQQILGSVKEALSYGANAFMFYTGAPQNTMRKEINETYLEEAKELMKKEGLDEKNVICHAPYIINLANNKDINKWHFSIDFLKKELERCDKLGVFYLVLHPGSAVGLSRDEAIQNIIDALNIVLETKYQCMILLETMALKGSEIGSFLDIKKIIQNVEAPVGVCLDTCHLSDAGYDLSNVDSVLDEFDTVIGLSKLHCIHLNDSRNEMGSHKDRHANIGYGMIGFEHLLAILNHPKLKEIPKILETPYVGKTWEDKNRIYPPYRFEIAMLRRAAFDEHLLDHILEYYNK